MVNTNVLVCVYIINSYESACVVLVWDIEVYSSQCFRFDSPRVNFGGQTMYFIILVYSYFKVLIIQY